MNIYLVTYSETWKANGAERKAFTNWKKAYNYLKQYDFQYSPDADLFHNGATEAFINKMKVE